MRPPRLLLWLGICLPLVALAGPWHAGPDNSAGWRWMTPAERVEHQRRLRSFTRYDECLAYQREHHALMAERAQRSGVVLQAHRSVCDELRDAGRLK
jgi:hypothetical protein